MSTAERIYEEVKTLPEDAAREVLDFVELLKARHAGQGETARTLSAAELAALAKELGTLVESQPMTSGDTVRGMRDEARY